MVLPKPLVPERRPRKVPTRPSSHTPVATSVSLVCVRVTLLQPVPMIVNSDSTPCTPYQNRSGWCGSSEHGPYDMQPTTLPSLGLALAARMLVAKRRLELENTGVLCFWASSKIISTSASEPPRGLSMNTFLP